MDVAKKRETLREKLNLLKTAQNNTIRTNHIKTRIDKLQQNSRCMLFDDRDQRVNHIRECNKLVQKVYKTRQDWVGKVIHWELCKKLKFDHMNKWYNPESVLENEMHKLLRNFEIQMDHLISTTRLSNNQYEKQNLLNSGLCCPG